MTTRSTALAIATLATLSVSALAPTQASAWGMGGYGGGYSFSSYRPLMRAHPYYCPRAWAFGMARRIDRPTVAYSAPAYTQAPVEAYAPAPAVSYQRPYLPRQTYAMGPTEAPRTGEVPAEQGYAPAPQTQASSPQQVEEQFEEPFEGTTGGSQQQPSQDRRPMNYPSREMQK